MPRGCVRNWPLHWEENIPQDILMRPVRNYKQVKQLVVGDRRPKHDTRESPSLIIGQCQTQVDICWRSDGHVTCNSQMEGAYIKKVHRVFGVETNGSIKGANCGEPLTKRGFLKQSRA